MSIIIKSGASADLLTIDPISKAARVSLYDALGNALIRQEGAALPASPYGIPIMGKDFNESRMFRVDSGGYLAQPNETLMWYDPVQGAAQNLIALWTQTLSASGTETQANGLITLNGSSLTTLGAGVLDISLKQFQKINFAPYVTRQRWRLVHYANAVWEYGFGNPASGTAVVVNNGAFFRRNTDGTLVGVIAYNGTEITTVNLAVPNSTDYYVYEVIWFDDSAKFTIYASDGTVYAEGFARLSATLAGNSAVSHASVFRRWYNNTAPATAPQFFGGSVYVSSYEAQQNLPYNWQHAKAGKHLQQNPFTTFGQTANLTNNAAPTTRTPSNTAAGEATLGGICSWNNAGTSFGASDVLDLIIFGYQNVSPYQMIITENVIDTINLGAVVGATEYTIMYFLDIGHTAITLAAGNHFKQMLGFQSLITSGVVGARFAPRIYDVCNTPITVEPGQFVRLVARVISGTATLNQVIRTAWTPRGVFV